MLSADASSAMHSSHAQRVDALLQPNATLLQRVHEQQHALEALQEQLRASHDRERGLHALVAGLQTALREKGERLDAVERQAARQADALSGQLHQIQSLAQEGRAARGELEAILSTAGWSMQ